MGNAFNRTAPQFGSVWVATYDRHARRYLRTVIVARGTPAPSGVFNDKTAIEADRGVNSPYDANVYTAFSVFQGGGNNEIKFSRSTDHGRTFSNPTRISEGSKGNQGADIAVTSNGDVYVTWNGTVGSRANGRDAMLFAKSTDGGKHFTKPRVAAEFDGFDAADFAGDPEAAARAHERAFENADGPESDVEPSSAGNSRDCGSGPFSCLSGFVFFRHHSSPHITADPKGDPRKLYLVYDASIPGTETASKSTYNTAPVGPNGTLRVAQGGIYLKISTNGGTSWSQPRLLAPSARRTPVLPRHQRRRRHDFRGVARQPQRPGLQRAKPARQRHSNRRAGLPPGDARAGHVRRLLDRRRQDLRRRQVVQPAPDAELRDVR
ncbi:MAG: sialidase family protein [Nocardioidaceae bacterium]